MDSYCTDFPRILTRYGRFIFISYIKAKEISLDLVRPILILTGQIKIIHQSDFFGFDQFETFL